MRAVVVVTVMALACKVLAAQGAVEMPVQQALLELQTGAAAQAGELLAGEIQAARALSSSKFLAPTPQHFLAVLRKPLQLAAGTKFIP